MDPLLLIIKYLFKKKNIDNNDNTIDEFFDNGLSFPQLISLIFDVDEIPKVIKNPKTLFHKKMNNDLALQFLCQKNTTIGKFNPSFNNDRDKKNLLLLIFTKQCYKINVNEIISKCNLIVQSLNIKFDKKSDIISANCLISLLNVLSDGKVPIGSSLDANKNIDETMSQFFSQAEAPLIINKSCLDIQNQNIFLIQIEILFDFYSDKINQIANNPQIQSKVDSNANSPDKSITQNIPDQHIPKLPEIKPIQKAQDQQPSQKVQDQEPSQKVQDQKPSQKVQDKTNADDKEEEDEEEENFDEAETQEEEVNQIPDIQYEDDDWKKIDEKIKKRKKKKKDDDESSSSDDDDEISLENKQEESLLKTLNVIGRGKFHFNNFHEAVINDSIPRFVMFYLNLKSIKKVHLKQTVKSVEKDQKITKEEINNINAVIKFLGTKESRFTVLKFDFKNQATEESSAVLFYSNFLNYFFIKTSKKDIHERCAILLCTKVSFRFDRYVDLKRPRTYGALLHLLINKNLHFKFYELPDEIEDLDGKFQEAKIPLVINSKIFDIGYRNLISDSVYYQLQLILNAFDSQKCFAVFGILMKVIFNLQNLKVPKYEEIAGSILAKRTSIEFQNARSEQYLKRADSTSLSESLSSFENIQLEPIKNPVKVNTFRTRQESKQKNDNQGTNIESNNQSMSEINEKFEKILKKANINCEYDNGIIYHKENNKNNIQRNWIDEIANIKNVTQKDHKKSSENDESLKLKFCSSKNSFKSKLYKIFVYDEGNKIWTFQSEVFDIFAADRHINIDDSKTPIVLFLNSYKDETISLVSNLINNVPPDVESEQDIFIYSLCDKTLSMLNYYVDFESKRKSSIKPIFLLLHIPKSKEKLPNLQQIIFEIYTFLTFVSDLEIVVLNKNHYIDQVENMKGIKNATKYFKTKFKQKDDFSSSDTSFDTDSSSYEEEDKIEDQEMEEDTWDEVNIIDNKKINEENLPEIIIRKAKILLLINDSEFHSSKEFKNTLKENQFFQDLRSRIDREEDLTKIRCINVKEPDSYEKFLNSFNSAIIRDYSSFHEVKTNFNSISFFKVTSTYTKIRCSGPDWKEILKKMILDRNNELYSNSSTASQNPFVLISQLSNELTQITPLFDIEFTSECNTVLSSLNSEGTKLNRKLYSNELEKSANSHLEFLSDKINEKFFWTEEQMDLLAKCHFSFLRDEFYEIIQLTSSDRIYNMIYEENYDILENQMKKSKTKIDEFFKPYIEKIKIKKNPQEQNLKEKIRKGANYSMKETENLREIKVTVQIKKDLRSEIEQDF